MEEEKSPNEIFKETLEWWAKDFPEYDKLGNDPNLLEWDVNACDVPFVDVEDEKGKVWNPYDRIQESFYEMLKFFPDLRFESLHGEDLWIGTYEGEPIAAAWCDGFSVWYLKDGRVEMELRSWKERFERIRKNAKSAVVLK